MLNNTHILAVYLDKYTNSHSSLFTNRLNELSYSVYSIYVLIRTQVSVLLYTLQQKITLTITLIEFKKFSISLLAISTPKL